MGGAVIVDLDPMSLVDVVVRTALVYLALLIGLRLAGKRELGQMTTFDLIVILLVANAVQNAMVGANVSLTAGIVAAATLIGLNAVVWRLGRRFRWMSEQLRGTPTLLVHEGVALREPLEREGVDREELLQALREHGVDDLAKVKEAVLEVDGTISVIPFEGAAGRTRRRVRGRKPAG